MESSDGLIGEWITTRKKWNEILWHDMLPVKKHGTGDIFASVFTANYLLGKGIHNSCQAAAEFVADCIKRTDKDHFYGVNFEKVLKRKNTNE